MEQLERLLNDFAKDRDIQKFLNAGVTLDIQVVQSHIQSLPDEQRVEFESRLADVMSALDDHIQKLTDDRDDLKSQIEGSEKTKKACLSYGSAQGLSGHTDKKQE